MGVVDHEAQHKGEPYTAFQAFITCVDCFFVEQHFCCNPSGQCRMCMSPDGWWKRAGMSRSVISVDCTLPPSNMSLTSLKSLQDNSEQQEAKIMQLLNIAKASR
jgi:hypothetical protein